MNNLDRRRLFRFHGACRAHALAAFRLGAQDTANTERAPGQSARWRWAGDRQGDGRRICLGHRARIARISTRHLRSLKKDYIDTGKIRFVFREFPHNEAALGGLHAGALRAQGKIFPADRHVLRAAGHLAASAARGPATRSPSRPASPRRASTRASRMRTWRRASSLCATQATSFGVDRHSDLLRQWRDGEGRDHDRGIPGEDRSAV